MKYPYFSLFLLFLINTADIAGQTFGHDAEGNSTIFSLSKNLQLDLNNNIANFTYYDAFRKKQKGYSDRDSLTIFGLELKGKEKDGLTNIFSGENLNTDATIKFLLGRRTFKKDTVSKKKVIKIIKKFKEVEASLEKKEEKAKEILKKYLEDKKIDSLQHKILRKYVSNKDLDSLKMEIEEIDLNELLNIVDSTYEKQSVQWKKLICKVNMEKEKYIIPVYNQPFVRGGINGASFKFDLANGETIVNNRFIDKNFYGWNFEVGWNIQRRNYNFWGISYRYDFTNNLNELESTEFNLTTIDTTITNGQFNTTEKIKAISGNFEEFGRHSLNIDYLRAISIADKKGKSSNLYITINPYFRFQLSEKTNTRKSENNWILGLGINAFNSKKQKIMGGIFAQVDTGKKKRFSIGLVARFSFSGINLETPKE